MGTFGGTSEYEILGKLASGGMADVFLARVRALDVQRYVVVKRILEVHRNDPSYVKMFLEEARLAARLQHPNIPQFHDIGELGDSFFYTMEYIHGLTLGAIAESTLMSGTPLEIEHVLQIASGVTAALHHAHTRMDDERRPLGIVHRDVTPVNIMISFDGAVKLIDFGVAKASNRDIKTEAGIVKGKVAYLSPEQINGRPIDGRSDLFSLGICLHELLTLRRMFLRENNLGTLLAIRDEEVPPPSAFRPAPPALDRFVMRALAKDPAARFASAQDMHEEVEQVAHELGLRLSTGALSRRVRGFGERPEPWVGLAVRPVTVARVPLPERAEMSAPRPVSRDMETKLGSLPRLPATPYAAAEDEQTTTLPFTARRSQVAIPETMMHGAAPPPRPTPRPTSRPTPPPPVQSGAPPVPPTIMFSNEPPAPPPPRPSSAEMPPTMMLPAAHSEPTRLTPNPLAAGPPPVVIPQAGPATMAIVLSSPSVQAYAASRAPRPHWTRHRLVAIIASSAIACVVGGLIIAIC